MARLVRATSLLLIALGVAAPVLPASAAAANTGGAAPGGEAVHSSAGSVGGAAPDATPARSATSSTVGGALPGHRPRHPKAKRRRAGARHRARRRTTREPAATPIPAPAPTPTPGVAPVAGVFPVQGPFDFGGDDARFGAGRPGHVHQGQDVVAASGTPLVAPVDATVIWKARQRGGAGIYLVLRGAGPGSGSESEPVSDEVRDYVFMHLRRGSVLVRPGDVVQAGQQIAQVGATGDASGPHLHFEIWVGGWFARDGAPIDPLPQLQRWAEL